MFQLDFDPTQLSYGELLTAIWANRRDGRAHGRQYMEAVYCADATQEACARRLGVAAPIITGAAFHLAEDDHQKYDLRRDRVLMRELAGYTPAQLVASRVGARGCATSCPDSACRARPPPTSSSSSRPDAVSLRRPHA